MNFFAHKTAIVESKSIGKDSRIWAHTHILPGAKIGENANICDFCFIENDVTLGNDVTVKCGVYLWDGITVEDNVMIGPAAVFTNDLFPRSKNTTYNLQKTVLKKGCSIGANATIIAGVTIGEHAMVGAGSVVTKSVPDYGLVYGNPASMHGFICVCTKKMLFEAEKYICECGRKYGTKNGATVEVLV